MKNWLKGGLFGLIVGILVSIPFIRIWCNRIFKLCFEHGDNCGCDIGVPILISLIFFILLGVLVGWLIGKRKKK